MNKRSFKICLFILTAFLFSSCEVIFENPIAKNTKFDKKIIGRWINADPKKEGFLEFAKKSDYLLDVTFSDGEEDSKCTASTKKIGKYNYINAFSPDVDKENLIVRYEIQNNEMTLWILDSDKIKVLIEQNKLEGYSKSLGAVVTDSSENVKKFLESAESNEAFELLAKLKKSEETTK